MCSKDCEQILNSTLSSFGIGSNNSDTQSSKNISQCFYSCCKKKYIKWASVIYKNYEPEMIDFIANSAFTDSILKFEEDSLNGKLYENNKKISAILFGYFKIKLLYHLQIENRLLDKKNKFNYYFKSINTISNEQMPTEELYLKLEKALNKLSPMDKQIIIWRHVDMKSVDIISSLLGINKESTSNRIYRCMERFKLIIQNIK